jgi:uncharacterized protein YegP (UPF0339 family)
MKFEIYEDAAHPGEIRWRLKAKNGQIIATSGEGYVDERDCRKAIRSVKRVNTRTPVERTTA